MVNMLDRDNQHLLLEKTDNTNNSFIANINKLAAKLNVITEAVGMFDDSVIPILEEIAELDLDAAIEDLEKGSYLGNRKIDINLALNVEGIDDKLIDKDPDAAEAIWTDPSKTVLYDKATCTFVDGTVIELPFIFDGNPATVSTHADLLTQFTRLDYVYAQSQVDSIYQFTVLSNENYVLTIDNVPYTFTSGVGATRESVIAGIANMINSTSIPITANVTETSVELTADVAGNPFYLTVSSNMQSTTIAANVIEGPRETEFLAKLNATLASSFAAPVVGEFIRFFDVIGDNSNLERIQLHAVSGYYKEENPIYYWAKTTSAFQTLAMRAGDVIKLGNAIDKLILLANSIEEVRALQERIPQLVDSYDVNGNPLGETTIYNSLDELMEIHSSLNALLAIYDDIRATGNQYIFTVGEDLQLVNSPIKEVATNLQTTNTVGLVGTHIDNVNTVAANITNVNTTANNIADVNLVASEIVPNLDEILLADDNAVIATNKAQEAAGSAQAASNSALLATQKSNEIKNVSVGSTITGAAGTNASVVYNPANGKFTFVVPQGVKGDRGDAFQVNSIGTITQRALYDNQISGFSYLAVDVVVDGSTIPHIYFKLSSSSGDWSVGTPFGRGDKGDTGDTGNGITQITFTSTTHVSGLAGQSGGVDTYTISYTNGTSDTFTLINGVDGQESLLEAIEVTVDSPAATYTVNVDTTSGSFEVFLNGLRLASTNYTLTGTSVVISVPVNTNDLIVVKKLHTFSVLDTYSQSVIDSKIESKVATKADQTAVNTALGLKADKSTTYTKLETNAKIVELAPSEINDAATTNGNTWSAQKISSEVAGLNSEDAGPGKTPKATADGVIKDEWLDGGLFKPGMLVASQAPLSAPEWLETGREYLNTAYPALREVLGTKTNEHPINLSNDLNIPNANSAHYRFSPDGQYLLTVRYGNNSSLRRITVWKRDGTTLTALTSPTFPQTVSNCAVAWFPDSVHFVAADQGALYIGKVENDVVSIIKTVTDSAIYSTAVAVSPNGTYIAITLNTTPHIRIYTHDTDWNLTSVTVPAVATFVTHFSFSPDSTHLVSRILNNTVIFNNTSPDVFTQVVTLSTASSSNGACAVSWHPSGKFMAVSMISSTTQAVLQVYQRSGNSYTLFASAAYSTTNTYIPGCSFTPDGRHIVFNINRTTLPIYRFLPKEETVDSRLLLINAWATTPAMEAAPAISPDCQLCITGATINLLGYDAKTSFHVPAAKADFAQTIYVKS